MRFRPSNLFGAACWLVLACGCDSADVAPSEPDAALPPPCSDERRPLVMAHGFLASGDTWALQAQRFASNGYCPGRIHAFDYNTLDQNADHVAELEAFIDAVRDTHGVDRVDLAAHSMGGLVSYDLLADAGRAAKVERYAHVGSIPQDSPAGPSGELPTLNVWSVNDTIVEDPTDIPGAINLMVPGKDHMAVASCAETFEALYAHFNGGEFPATLAVLPEAPERVRLISGKVVALGENTPGAGWVVEIYDLHSDTGARRATRPLATFVADGDGWWGHFPAVPDTHYELYVSSPQDPEAVPIHYYREPIVRTNTMMYLRTLPDPYTLAGLILGDVRYDDAATVLVNFTSSTAVLHGQDSLTVAGTELVTAELAPPEDTTIAMFLYDGDEDRVSDETPLAIFGSLPFLNGMDLFLPTDPAGFIPVEFNGRVLNVPNWRSESDGVVITVFD